MLTPRTPSQSLIFITYDSDQELNKEKKSYNLQMGKTPSEVNYPLEAETTFGVSLPCSTSWDD